MSPTTGGTLVPPRALLVLPVREAVFDLATETWDVSGPWGPYRFLPPGANFPFRELDVWVYTQLTGGLGAVRLGVEFRQRIDTATNQFRWRAICHSVPTVIDFGLNASRLAVYDTAFRFKKLPFREEGVYDFRVYAESATGFQAVNGPTAELTMLHPNGRV
jgi:hypothetical protein